MPVRTTTGIECWCAASATRLDPECVTSPPFARTACAGRRTLLTRDITANMAVSCINVMVMLEMEERFSAMVCPP